MRWTIPYRLPNIKQTIDHYHLYNRTLMLLRTKMAGAGSPCTYWKNTAIDIYGRLDASKTKCYCWKKTESDDEIMQSQPDRSHALCIGTGILEGYQKYGYEEIVVSTPSTVTFSSDEIVVGQDATGEPDRFVMSSNSSTEEYLETENFVLTNFQAVDRFLATESSKADTNKVEYYYSTNDGGDWTQLTMIDHTANALGNKEASGFTLPVGTLQIKFRVTLRKRYNTSSSPLFNSIRFRYRNRRIFSNIDPRFNVNIPAFLASREAPKEIIEQGKFGWKTVKPISWWVLPEANVEEASIIMFLQGEFANEKYEIQDVTKHVYGSDLKPLHRSFSSAFLRDKYDLIRIVDLLT